VESMSDNTKRTLNETTGEAVAAPSGEVPPAEAEAATTTTP
jgi:hypothetical protein